MLPQSCHISSTGKCFPGRPAWSACPFWVLDMLFQVVGIYGPSVILSSGSFGRTRVFMVLLRICCPGPPRACEKMGCWGAICFDCTCYRLYESQSQSLLPGYSVLKRLASPFIYFIYSAAAQNCYFKDSLALTKKSMFWKQLPYSVYLYTQDTHTIFNSKTYVCAFNSHGTWSELFLNSWQWGLSLPIFLQVFF